MPPAPELGDAGGGVGQIEVGRALKAHHQAQTVAHLRIAGKIEVELEGIGKNPQPGQRQRGVGQTNPSDPDDILPQSGNGIRQDDLFRHSKDKHLGALLGPGQGAASCGVMERLGHFPIFDNGANNELGIHQNIRRKRHHAALRFYLAGIDVGKIADELEGIIADAQWKDIKKRKLCQLEGGDCIERFNQEIGIFAQYQCRRADCNGSNQDRLAAAPLGHTLNGQPAKVSDRHQGQNQRQPANAGPAVKDQAFTEQNGIFGPGRGQIINAKGQRHKTKEKHNAVENQNINPPSRNPMGETNRPLPETGSGLRRA